MRKKPVARNAPLTSPLLATKLFIPPTRPSERVVSRLRLFAQLDECLPGPSGEFARRLTLVSAPAGFGKTTLVSEWVNAVGDSSPIAIAWLSLDEGDNDPSRFLTYLVAALQTLARGQVKGVHANIGKGALSALESAQPPPPEVILTTLINEIAAITVPVLLVLDDLHLIETKPIHDGLAFLLEHLPARMHLAIATRDDPQFPLARLRARGHLSELRATDLRFSSAEAAEFLNQVMGLGLSEQDVAALETRTEGWIAGLQLAAISMQGRQDVSAFVESFTGSHRFVLDYLVEEVLHQQSEGVQAFLLQTAVLDRITGPLCDHVTGEVNGQAMLEMLERDNLFIVRLDEERRWYRYHHLFASFLRLRLRQMQPELVPTLHRRASDWYEQHGFANDAIEHALRGEDFDRAARQIENVAAAEWTPGGKAKLQRWLELLPVEIVLSRPQLGVYLAWYQLASGQQGAAERILGEVERALRSSPDGASERDSQGRDEGIEPETRTVRGRLATAQAFAAFYRGDAAGIIQHGRRALELLPEQDAAWRGPAIHILGDAYDLNGAMEQAYQSRLEALEASRAAGDSSLGMIINLKLALVLRNQGHLERVKEICREQMRIAKTSGMAQTVIVGWLQAIWGEVLAETNDLDQAIRRTTEGVEIAQGGGDLAMLGWSYICLIRTLFSSGNPSGAEDVVRKLEDTARKAFVPPWMVDLSAAWLARIWLAQGKLAAAVQWAADRGLDASATLTYQRELEFIVLARILIAEGHLGTATSLLQRLFKEAEAGGRTWRMIEISLLQALAYQAQGATDEALAGLQKAVTLAEPGGFVRTFVDEGPGMARLLYKAQGRDIAPEYVHQLLSAFPVAEAKKTGPPASRSRDSEWVEPLSDRELEVLQLIADGLSNPEIASRLFLALNTVKTHTRNIYGKLGVHSRTQAIATGRKLGILPQR